MDIIYSYSHLGGEEILLVRFPALDQEINDVIKEIPYPGRNKKCKEVKKKGSMLYSPKELNYLFKEGFNSRGWSEIRDRFDIVLPDYTYAVKGAFKQCDFLKDNVIVEVQFGKYAFMFYDLAKFQYFYNQGKINVGVEVVPCYFLHKQMSSGVSYGEQLVYDLERLSKNFPSVPVKIILIDMPLKNDDYFLEERREAISLQKIKDSKIGDWKKIHRT